MILANRMHHFAIVASDLDAATEWYREMLGFEVERRFGFPEAGIEIAHLLCGELRIEIIARQGSAAGSDVGRDAFSALLTQGAKHIGFLVDDIEAVAGELKRRGAEVVHEPVAVEPAGVMTFWIRDPDGTLIEFDQWL